MTSPSEFLLLDASCLLNLYATGRLREIALALPYPLGVTDYVCEQEALYMWRPDPSGNREEREPVDISPLIDEGLIEVAHLESVEEEATFIDLAAQIDDGEAVTGALALHRGYSLATDDRKARRVLGESAPTVPLVSTLELVKLWAEASSASPDVLRSALDGMRTGASYIPGDRDPLYSWWSEVMGSGTP